jgi:IS30 family transposase
LSLTERVELYAAVREGESLRNIAKRLHRSDSSLSRELRRHSKYGRAYKPVQANTRAVKTAVNQRSRAPLKCPEILQYVRTKLELGWSPQTIAGRLTIDHPSLSTNYESIYRWIYSKPWCKDSLYKYLDLGRKKRRIRSGRGVHSYAQVLEAKSINSRLEVINNRSTLGHWETDLMESSREVSTALSVTIERKTRYTLIIKVDNKTATEKTKALKKQFRGLPTELTLSMTLDRGTENSEYVKWEVDLKLTAYFCNPYHSWEKGAVENTNKRIRRFIPKGSNISEYSDKQIQHIQDWINHKPMKCLQYLTPYEMMQTELKNLRLRS